MKSIERFNIKKVFLFVSMVFVLLVSFFIGSNKTYASATRDLWRDASLVNTIGGINGIPVLDDTNKTALVLNKFSNIKTSPYKEDNSSITPDVLAGTLASQYLNSINSTDGTGKGIDRNSAEYQQFKDSVYSSVLNAINNSSCSDGSCASKLILDVKTANDTYRTKTTTDPALLAKQLSNNNKILNSKVIDSDPPEEIYCIKGGISLNFGISIPGCLAIGSYMVMYATSWVLTIAALLFDFSINYTLSMHDVLASFSAIQYGWELFRNFINLFFILILVYISIATILQIDEYGYQKLLGKLVLAAFLINFSMFFTEVIIDLSNITSLVFYNQILLDAKSASGVASSSSSSSNYVSLGIMSSLGFQGIWGAINSSGGGNSFGSTGSGATNNPAINAGSGIAQAGGASIVLNPWKMILIGIGGSVFILILSFIFFAASALFIVRLITLVFLIITSPIAFAANVLPKTSEYSKSWWKKLNSNALFAPVYMLMMYIALKMVWYGSDKPTNLLAIFANEDPAGIKTIMFFVLICGMLIACLTVATSLGAKGAGTVSKWGSSAKNWGYRRLGTPVGYFADKASRSAKIARIPVLGGALLQGADKLAGMKVGGASYRSMVDDGKADYKKRGELIGKAIAGDLKRIEGETDADFAGRKIGVSKKAQAEYHGVKEDAAGNRSSSGFPFSRARQQASADYIEAGYKKKTDAAEKSKVTEESALKDTFESAIKHLKTVGDAETENLLDQILGRDPSNRSEEKFKVGDAKPEEIMEKIKLLGGPIDKLREEIKEAGDGIQREADVLKSSTAKSSEKRNALSSMTGFKASMDVAASRMKVLSEFVSKAENHLSKAQQASAQIATKEAIEGNKPAPAGK